MSPTTILGFLLLLTGSLAADLFTFVTSPPIGKEQIKTCQSDQFVSCSVVEVNFGALDDEVLTLPGDWELSLLDAPAEGSVTFTDSSGTEATFTRHQSEGGDFKVIGNVAFSDGRDFMLEPCLAFPGCHVWMEADVRSWKVDNVSDVHVMEEEKRYAELNRRTADPAKIQQGKDDSTTIVTYSVMFYYTPEFAASTEDIPLFMAQVIAETNQGYINSKVPMRIQAHCVRQIDLHDIADSSEMLDAFRNHKPLAELLNTADAAHLFVDRFDGCGIASFGSFMWGSNLGVTMKTCALGIYTVGHEIGHNFGCLHDPVQAANTDYPYGLGSHIPGTNKMTVMAYPHGENTREINYYSAPDVFYQGIVTGSATQDNARVLREHRFAMADTGDESGSCDSGTVTTTVTTTPTTTTNTATTTTATTITTNTAPNTGTVTTTVTTTHTTTTSTTTTTTATTITTTTAPNTGTEYTTVSTCTCPTPSTTTPTSNTNTATTTTTETTATTNTTTTNTTAAPTTEMTGEMTSGNYPSEYSNNVDTTETILAAERSTIKIRFDALDIEYGGSTCDFDYISIVDGDGSVLMGKTCGNNIPDDIESFTNRVNVIFHTDSSVSKSGWKLTWTSGQFPPRRQLGSENYPAEYPNFLDKTYDMEVMEGNKIKISFDHLDIEFHSNCAYDYVMITDDDGTLLLPRTCGTTKPADVTSTSSKAQVIFHSDSSETKTGFHLFWTEFSP